MTTQPWVLAIEVERGVLSACLVSVFHGKLRTGHYFTPIVLSWVDVMLQRVFQHLLIRSV